MVGVLDRKLLREIRAARGRLLAITTIIAVGIACFVESRALYRNLTQAQQSYYARARMADFWIDLKKVPVSELAALERVAEITDYRPRIQFTATVDLEHVPKLLNAQVLSLPDRRAAVINDIVLRSGGYFSERRRNEVIVNDAFARHHRLQPGAAIHLIMNNRRQELFVVGTAISSEFVYLVGPGTIVPDPAHFGVFYLKNSFAEEVLDFQGAANQVVGTLEPHAREGPADVLRRAEALLTSYGVFSTTALEEQASNRYLTQEIEGIRVFTVVMPTMFLAVAALVLNVLLRRMAEQQRTIVGTLKALGYDDRQVFAHFLKFGLSVGLVGGLAGCALGHLLAVWVTGIYRQFYEFPVLEARFHPIDAAAGLAISVVCAVLGSWHGARTVLKLQPAEAMRPRPPARGGKIFLERFAGGWRRLGFGWRMVLRSIVRHRFRTAAGLFTAAMGTSILVAGFMLHESIYHLMDFQFDFVQRGDLELSFKDERSFDALAEARRLPGVDAAEPVLDVACTFANGPYHRRGSITGLERGAELTVPRDEQGRPIRVPSSGVAMSRKLAELLHVSRGDVVSVRPIKGRRLERQVPVVEISDGYLGMSVYAEVGYLNRLIGEEQALTGVQLLVDPRPERRAELHRQVKQLPAVQAVYARGDFRHNLEDTVIKTQRIFILILIGYAGIIFFGSILNSSLISLSEREREVAMLRVLGYTPWQVGGLFLRENLVVTLAGTLLGMPLGYQLTVLLAHSYDNELFRFPVVSTPSTWLATLALAAAFGLLAHGFVQREIHRLAWVDGLKRVE